MANFFDDGGTPDDPCDDLYEYRDLSQDIYVMKSEDGGATWTNPYNATSTPDNPEDYPSDWNGACPYVVQKRHILTQLHGVLKMKSSIFSKCQTTVLMK